MKILILILSKLLYWSIPLGLFVWSIFSPATATYIFLAATAIFEGYLFFIDRANRPNPDPSRWSQEEIDVLRKYHLALRYPFGAKDMSVVLNGFRWSALLWVPWLLWNQMWVFAVIIALNFFIAGDLSFRLDPFFFLSDAVNRGKYQFAGELSLLQEVAEKISGHRPS